ncbi:hypothetical protein [Pedobacter mucosus]|uniref:hypothetical protein n=1 Tax=Pedobacter mucosus TaxID=2895286 RepID=UPI001EE42AEE|nr:hypothetical protein [Pedobacter mucosus]UKT62268.1 hypothetical protein LOK61_10890 [Pedobacter mucosus]
MKGKLLITVLLGATIFASCTDSEKKTTQEKDKNYEDTTKVKQDSAVRVNPEDTTRKY